MFSGFASPAVITTLFISLLGGALQQTGVADAIGRQAHRLAGERELWLIVVVMLTAGLLSSFMPLSFAAVLGGTMTAVGTPPNILAGSILQEQGGEALDLFDFTPVGACLLAAGILDMVTLGRRFLPDRGVSRTNLAGRDLTRLYHLEERLFTIRIPRPSRLDGLTLAETRLGRALRCQVLAIRRHGQTSLAPGADTVLRSGDVLLTAGRLEDGHDGAEALEALVHPLLGEQQLSRVEQAGREQVLATDRLAHLGGVPSAFQHGRHVLVNDGDGDRIGLDGVRAERGLEVVHDHLATGLKSG